MAETEKVKPYNYFETPDGQDIHKKLWFVLKPTAISAFALSTLDVMLHSHPKGYMKTLGRYVYISLPVFGVATAFVLTTNLAASIRNKDDKVNWFLGGAAAGSVLGVWRRRPMVGFNMAMVLGLAAIIKKDSVQKGWVFTPSNDTPIGYGNAWFTHTDFSLTKDRPGNWVTGKE